MNGPRRRLLAALASTAIMLASSTFSATVAATDRSACTFWIEDETEPAVETSVMLPGEGRQVPGVLTPPGESDGPVPAVLLLHGYGSDKHEIGSLYERWADALADHGVASLRIDFVGMGDSESSVLDYTYDSQVSGAAMAMDWLESLERVDPDRMGVHGFGMGARIGAHVAGTDPRVAAFGSWRGDIQDGGHSSSYDEQMLTDCDVAGGRVSLDLGWRTLEHGCDFFASMLASTALSDLLPFERPVLLVVGAEATVVPPSVSEAVTARAASTDVSLEVIKGAVHVFDVLTDDQAPAERAIAATAEWFAVKLWLAPRRQG